MTVCFSLRPSRRPALLLRWALVFALVCTLAACGSNESLPVPFQESSADRTEAIAVLSRLDDTDFRDMFSQLDGTDYERVLEYEEISAQQASGAGYRLVTRTAGGTVSVVSETGGGFSTPQPRNSDSSQQSQFDPSITSSMVPDTTAYRPVRKQEQYLYRILADSTVAGAPARVIELAANPASATIPEIRRLRFYVRSADGRDQLVGIEMDYSVEGWLYEESSKIRLFGRVMGNSLLPADTEYEMKVGIPLSGTRHYRASAVYSAIW